MPLFLVNDLRVRDHEQVVPEVLEDQLFVVDAESNDACEAIGVDIGVGSVEKTFIVLRLMILDPEL